MRGGRMSLKSLKKYLVYIVILGAVGFCSVAFAAQNSWIQTDWLQGQGTSTTDQYFEALDVDASVPEDLTLAGVAGWAYPDWSHRQEITVANASAQQTDYQVRLIVAYAAGMQADFDDLRFSNAAGAELDFWLHTKIDSVEAEIWVEVDDLAAVGDTTIYIYYGNDSAASASDGEETFLFFDDFDEGTLDPIKWIEVDIPADEIRVENGWLVFERLINGSWNKAVIANTNFAHSDLSFESDYEWVNNNAQYDAIMYGWHDSGTGASYPHLVYAYYNTGSGGASTVGTHVYEDGVSRSGEIGSWTVGTDYDVRVRMRESGGAYYEQSEDGGDTWLVSYTSTYSTEADLRPAWSFYSGTHHYDNARVRKWMDIEPVATFGEVEMRYALSGQLTSNIFDTSAEGSHWGEVSYQSEGAGTVVVKVRTSHDASMAGAPDFAACPAVTSGDDVTGNGCAEDGHRYVQYRVVLEGDGADTPVFNEISIGFSPASVIANAGDDRTIGAGRAFRLDGSVSAGEDLSYNWALVSGDGRLTSVQSATPVYSSDSDAQNQNILIYLTVRNAMGDVDTDEITLSLVGTKSYEGMSENLVGEIGGKTIYESVDVTTARPKLDIGGDEVVLPVDGSDYVLGATSDNRLIVGLPDMNDESGSVYLLAQPAGSAGRVDLAENSDAFKSVDGNQAGDRLGAFITSGDLDGDGEDELVVGAPGATPYGTATVYDAELSAEVILVGTDGHPVNSLLIGNDIALGYKFVAFGPGNPAFNSNLSFNADASASLTPFALLPAEPQYLSGVVVLDDDVLESPTEPGVDATLLSLGDLNGDGSSDILLSSDSNVSFVLFDASVPSAAAQVIDPNAALVGISGVNLYGQKAVVGDVSGDGVADVVLGAPNYDSSERGAIFVIFGSPVWSGTTDLVSSGNVLQLSGSTPGDSIGSDIVLVDADGDGVEEIYTIKASGDVVKFDLLSSGSGGASAEGSCSLNPSGKPTSVGPFWFALLAFLALLALLARRSSYAYTR